MTLSEMHKLKPGDEIVCLFATISMSERRRCTVVSVEDQHVVVRLQSGDVVRKKCYMVAKKCRKVSQ